MDINKGQVQQVSKLADYEVKTEKVSGKYSGIYKAKKPVYYMNLAKDLAVGDAILKAKCDFLIHPLYDIKVSGESIEVTVEGYPANYIKFETVEYTTTYSEEPQTPDNSSNTQNFINRFIK